MLCHLESQAKETGNRSSTNKQSKLNAFQYVVHNLISSEYFKMFIYNCIWYK